MNEGQSDATAQAALEQDYDDPTLVYDDDEEVLDDGVEDDVAGANAAEVDEGEDSEGAEEGPEGAEGGEGDDGAVALDDVAKDLNLTTDQLLEATVSLEVGGETKDIPLSEVVSAFEGNQEHEARAQALDEEQAAFEDAYRGLSDRRAIQESSVTGHGDALMGIVDNIFNSNEMAELERSDPAQFLVSMRQLDTVKGQIAEQVEAAKEQFASQRKQDEDVVYQAHVAHLRRDGMSDEAISRHAKTLGQEYNITYEGAVYAGASSLIKMAAKIEQLTKENADLAKFKTTAERARTQAQGRQARNAGGTARSGRRATPAGTSRAADRLRKQGHEESMASVLDQIGAGEHNPGRRSAL